MSITGRRSPTKATEGRRELKMEQYEALEMEVIAFDTEDVITTSTNKDIEMPEQPIGG